MARHMSGEQAVAYRAVVTWTWPPGTYGDQPEAVTHTYYYGPYASAGTARATISRERRGASRGWYVRSDVVVEGHVERSSIVWEPEQ